MADFTDVELGLLKSITESRLRSNLEKIREAAEDIWAEDSTRIVQFYTDHGIKHSERLARIANDLLKANNGSPLSQNEMYLLLASIYLHDIGMQCDVLKFPEIRELAEKLGAEFSLSFDKGVGGKYNLEMQKAIRKNHQYITAAWIDHANRTGTTTLGTAAKDISPKLVDDLIDVCKHHSKLPIANCSQTLKYDPNGRKRLVASLLRFSDELDIDAHRVTLATVKNFSFDPRSGIYWWLHNRTDAIFTSRNVVRLTVRLHPDDLAKHGTTINEIYLNEFQTKNRPILTVLAQNGIPILISDDSKSIENDREERLPYDIQHVLESWNSSREPLLILADEICIWMRAIHYELSDIRRLNERTAELEASLEQGTVRQRLLIRFIDGEISAEDVNLLDATLNRKIPQGWLISDKRVSNSARREASQEDSIQVFNLSEFLQQKVWGPYIDALSSLVKRDHIPEFYVDLACYKFEASDTGDESKKDKYHSLDGYIDNWLSERGKVHISLLGEFGTGKTWFCRHYAYKQLENYINDPANERLPLLITLRAFAKSMTPQQLINDALLEQYKLPFVGSAFEVFKEMNRRGKILLILDGFDEMAKQVVKQTVIDNFWELAKLVDDKSKVILTSRTEYFRWAKEAQSILAGEEYGRSTIVLSPPKFEVIYLEPFDNQKITDVIVRRLGEESGLITAKRILDIPNLAEMAKKPVLIELLLASMDEISKNVLENQAQIYLYATNKLLMRNIKTERTFTTTSDKLYFLCELAWEMIRNGQLRINYAEIPKRIGNYFGEKIKSPHELDNWDFDLRNQTLLHRDAAGYYEFAHKSLAEYFVAFKFAAELGILAPIFFQTYCESDGKPCKLSIEKRNFIELSDSIGSESLRDLKMKEVAEFLKDMSSEKTSKILWDVLEHIRGKSSEQVKYIGGNALTILNNLGQSFVDKDLSNSFINGADLRNCNLTKININKSFFKSSDLRGSRFRQADFDSANFEGCDGTLFLFLNERQSKDSNGIKSKDLNSITYSLIQKEEEYLAIPKKNFPRFFKEKLAEYGLEKLDLYDISRIVITEFAEQQLVTAEFLFGSEDIYKIIKDLSSSKTELKWAFFSENIEHLKTSLSPNINKKIERYKPNSKFLKFNYIESNYIGIESKFVVWKKTGDSSELRMI